MGSRGGETLKKRPYGGLLERGRADIIDIEGSRVKTSRITTSLCTIAALAALFTGNYAPASPGIAGADVLKIPVEARGWGLGQAYSVIGDDASCMMYNPAGLCLSSERQLQFTHLSMLEGTYHESLLAALPLARWGSAGVLFNYRGMPEINNGTYTEDPPVTVYDTVLGGYLSFRFSHLMPGVRMVSPLSVGLGIKKVWMTILPVTQDSGAVGAVALDWGFLLQLDPFRIGLSGQNFGGGFKFPGGAEGESDPLPSTMHFALGAIPFEDAGNFLIVAIEDASYVGVSTKQKEGDGYRKISESLNTFSIGAEYWRLKKMGVRFGYTIPWGPEKSSYAGAQGISVGGSVRIFSDWLTYQIDIAYRPYHIGADRQDAFSLSLGIKF